MLKKPICPDKLSEMYALGVPLSRIALEFDCNKKTIQRRAWVLGLVHPHSPHERQRLIYAALDRAYVVGIYNQGTSLSELASRFDTSVDVLREYLVSRNVKIRTRLEQVEMTMQKHGTRFYKRLEPSAPISINSHRFMQLVRRVDDLLMNSDRSDNTIARECGCLPEFVRRQRRFFNAIRDDV